MADPNAPLPRALFRPHVLENLALVDELESLNPIIDCKVLNLLPNAGTPQTFAACGRGSRSTFRTLRYGLEADEAINFDLRGIPTSVWTTKLKEDGERVYSCPSMIGVLRRPNRPVRRLHRLIFHQWHVGALRRRDHYRR